MRRLAGIAAVSAGLFFAASPAQAQEGIDIRSDSLSIQERSGDIRFEGNVAVRMDGVTLNCDVLTVRADSTDTSVIRSGRALGDVVLVRDTDRVEAMEAVFDLENGKVELTGSPRLVREETIIEAQRIVYSLDEGSASFSGPVRAVFRGTED